MRHLILTAVLGVSGTTAIAGSASNGLQLNGVVSNVITINAASPRDRDAHQALISMAARKLGG
ncbi:hypothetical protein SULPSESMR1_03654 (plasmid) [Pseudosulfitobacter pseudonitzschiae]|uniref:Uncharacterized protein n=1 Tax=Pseudosulfitobacter pseudonitzschiae TaxID=1402135 RepID=A0A221K8W8_9RHOB|nr:MULTISPECIES: hypothetical protein [Roseobacteraceae]ASM75452.1 hypothetical protein SULPSESMR1_03654 [Pseudosulfitobacter pseudonitzschiae]